MTLFNDHQIRLWIDMEKSIQDFRNGKIGYYRMVGALEGALEAGEFKNKNLIKNWYDLWTPLEIIRATSGDDVSQQEVNQYLTNMEDFLKSQWNSTC